MSLFPAYSRESSNKSNSNKQEGDEWLSNSSFKGVPLKQKIIINISSDSSSEDDTEIETKLKSETISNDNDHSLYEKNKNDSREYKKYKKHKKNKKHKKTDIVNYEKDVKDLYFEDKNRDVIYFTIKTLHGRARPAYNISDKYLGFICSKKLKKTDFIRYHSIVIDNVKGSKKKVLKTKTEKKSVNNLEECNSMLDIHRKNKTQDFNEKLAKNSNDIKTWMEYISFQDEISKFSNFKSQNDNKRITLEKQLSIANKAFEANPNSSELLQLKLKITSELIPADTFFSEIESLLNKDPTNIILWQALITVLRSSVALCSMPKIMELYCKCFKTLRQKLKLSPDICDSHLLGILYESLIFLRHTGHWEQMWETMKFNLVLNLNISQDNLKFNGIIDEKKLIDLEEVILTSGLPLNQLWLRVESLRERCHWITVNKEHLELIGDSKRFILPEDITDFVHPLMQRESNFHMGIYFLLSLKVPLLPTRHYVFEALNLNALNWSFESLEIALPIIYPQVGEIAGYNYRKNILKGLLEMQLTSGPQFLVFHPAQEPYLDFVRMNFQAIASALPNYQRTSIYVWWLRFERLLIFLGKGVTKIDQKGKKIKSIIKEFLKKPENRNNLHFYREYALIEFEFGRIDSCLNILETGITSLGSSSSCLSNIEEKSAVFSIFRSLFEIYFKYTDEDLLIKERILKIISILIPDNYGNDRLTKVENYLENCVKVFLNEKCINNVNYDYFMSNLNCDIITCYAYTLCIKHNDINVIINLFAMCLEHTKTNKILEEQLYECKITILQFYYEKNGQLYNTLRDAVQEALQLYKNNFYIISVYSELQSKLSFWQVSSKKNLNFELSQSIALCLTSRTRIQKLRSLGLLDSANAMLNKTLSLYKTLTSTKNIQCSPIIWRLYMLLLREENLSEKNGEEVYHGSIINCPWARCIYIDAAEIAPQKLTQIQDVIREKELRIHITPEELDILRG